MEAISFHKDQMVVGRARIMGLRIALSYAGCLELSGGMD